MRDLVKDKDAQENTLFYAIGMARGKSEWRKEGCVKRIRRKGYLDQALPRRMGKRGNGTGWGTCSSVRKKGGKTG